MAFLKNRRLTIIMHERVTYSQDSSLSEEEKPQHQRVELVGQDRQLKKRQINQLMLMLLRD